MKEYKEAYISECIDFLKNNFPERTTEYDKCVRDLEFIYDSITLDVENNTDENTKNVSAQFWHRGDCQLKHPETEIKVYDYLATLILKDNPNLESKIYKLIGIIKTTITTTGPMFKLGNKCDLDLVHKLKTLAQNRHNWKPLIGDKPTEEHQTLILSAASGVTPALSNEYNYRVDEVPDRLKQNLFESLVQWSQAAELSGNINYANDKNEQLMAPMVLCFSLRYNRNNTNIIQACGDMTDRDPNVLNLGLCIWNTVLTAEALGYKTGLCQVTGWKQETAKDILGLNTDEPQSEHLTRRNGECTFMPMFFLGIGTKGKTNRNTRLFKTEKNIVNTLKFN